MKIIYGWESADRFQLYVYQYIDNDFVEWWGVDYDFSKALELDSIDDCINHWNSKHASPKDYEHLLNEDHLRFFNAITLQRLMY